MTQLAALLTPSTKMVVIAIIISEISTTSLPCAAGPQTPGSELSRPHPSPGMLCCMQNKRGRRTNRAHEAHNLGCTNLKLFQTEKEHMKRVAK